MAMMLSGWVCGTAWWVCKAARLCFQALMVGPAEGTGWGSDRSGLKERGRW